MAELKDIVSDLIARKHEEEWYEFKMNILDHRALGEYISSLSNAAAMYGREYGYMIWGIENNTHRVLGTEMDYHQDVKNEPIQHFLERQMKPDIAFSFDELDYDGKRLVVLTIPAAVKTPTAFARERFLRIGSSKVNLMDYPDREAQLFNVLQNGLPDIINTESDYQHPTFNKLFVYYATKGLELNKATFEDNLDFRTPNGKYNILAQLLSDDSHISVRFGLFTGNDKVSTMYALNEFGNTCLLYSLDEVLRYGDMLNIPQANERNRATTRDEIPLFNKEAFHEAAINAFVHNAWVTENAPIFYGFRDRIEILSFGDLPVGQTIEGFFAGKSVPVNPKLAEIFLQLHISERMGRGFLNSASFALKASYQ